MKKKLYAVAMDVPGRNNSVFTTNKAYPVIDEADGGAFRIKADDGHIAYCLWRECSYLDMKDWRRVERVQTRMSCEIVMHHQISVWDDGDSVADRYTVVYLDTANEDGGVDYIGMSGAPTHPQGFCQHGEMYLRNVAYKGRGGCFKKRIRFADLPEECRKIVERELKEMEV